MKYPLALSSLKSLRTLLIGKETHLGIKISNISKRKYSGKLNIDLISNNYDAVVTNSFEEPSILLASSSKELVNAKVLVKDKRSVLKPISFSANVYKDGVLIGHTSSSYSTMAKMIYQEKLNAPVIAFNSFEDTSKVRALIEKSGGSDKVSLLDFSLVSHNFKAISKGLNSKDVIFFGKYNQTIDQDMKLFINQSQNMTYILSHTKDFYRNMKKMKKFNGTKDFKLNLKGLNFPILLVISKNKEASSVIYSNDPDYSDIINLSKYLKLSNKELINSLKGIAYQDFLNLSKENLFLVQAVHLRSISELLVINTKYKQSDEDESILEQIEDNKDLIHNLLRDEIKKYSDKDAGLFLFAYDYNEVLDFALNEWKQVEDEIDSDLTKILYGGWFSGGLLKPFKKIGKILKKEIKSTYKKAKKQVGHTAPFEFED